jgi:hypothetical protein
VKKETSHKNTIDAKIWKTSTPRKPGLVKHFFNLVRNINKTPQLK